MLQRLYIYPSTTKVIAIAKQASKPPIVVEPKTCVTIGLTEIEPNTLITGINRKNVPLAYSQLKDECGEYQFVIANNSPMHQACIYETTANTIGIFSCVDKNNTVEIKENQFFLIGLQKLFFRIESNINNSRNDFILYWIGSNGSTCSFNIKSEVTIGRSPKNNVVFLNDPYISKYHCIVYCESNKVYAKNTSTNGLWCNIMDKGMACFAYNPENIKWGVLEGFQSSQQELVISCHNCLYFFITYIPWEQRMYTIKD